MKLICKKNSLKGKKADGPYNSDLTLFTLNLKTRENQKDFAARTWSPECPHPCDYLSWGESITGPTGLGIRYYHVIMTIMFKTWQYQRRYNLDPTTKPDTLTFYYVCRNVGAWLRCGFFLYVSWAIYKMQLLLLCMELRWIAHLHFLGSWRI